MAAELVKTDARLVSLRSILEASKTQIKLALPKHLSPDRMLRLTMTSIRKTPALLDCTPQSLIGAVMFLAQLGLEPDDGRGLAYLIPFSVYDKTIKKSIAVVTPIIGYRGEIDLARRGSDGLSTVQVRVVYEADEWDLNYGLNERLYHVPARTDKPGAVVAAYCIAKMRDGGVQWEWMWREQIEAIRKQSKQPNGKLWTEHYDEACKKTVIRRASKLWPASVELERAHAVEDRAEAGRPADLSSVIEAREVPDLDEDDEPPAERPTPTARARAGKAGDKAPEAAATPATATETPREATGTKVCGTCDLADGKHEDGCPEAPDGAE